MLNRNKNIKKRNKNKNRKQRFGIDRTAMLVRAYGRIIQNSMNFLPPWIEVPMRYVATLNLNVLGGTFLEYILRGNSLFDPDFTGVGHQPLGFDQLTPVYFRYRVDRVEWYIEIASGTLSFSAGVVLINGAAVLTSMEQMLEYPTARCHTVGFNGAPPAIFTGHKKLAVFNGRSELNYNLEEDTSAVVTANPVEAINLHIGINNPNVATISGVQVIVNLKYRAVFFDPITPASSFKKIEKEKEIETPVVKSGCVSMDSESELALFEEYLAINSAGGFPASFEKYKDFLRAQNSIRRVLL